MMSDEDRTFVPLLKLLEATYDESGLDPDTALALVRYALASDNILAYWLERALNWVGHGVDPAAVAEELRALSRRDRSWPQSLRHHAKRLTPRS